MPSQEGIRDLMGRTLRAGDGVSIVVDDPGNTITLSAEGGGGDDPAVDQLQTDVTQLQTDLGALQSAHDALRDEHDSLATAHDSLQGNHDALETRVAALESPEA